MNPLVSEDSIDASPFPQVLDPSRRSLEQVPKRKKETLVYRAKKTNLAVSDF